MAASSPTLADAIRAAGIVGAGGAGFPSHVKAASEVEYVIANGAECEPLLRVDQQIMARFADRVVAGLALLKGATKARHAVIGLKAKYHDAIHALEPIIGRHGIELARLGAFYPAGDEVTLVYEVTGRIVPEAGLPLNVGCVVQNVHTLLWIADAAEGRPVTERFVTVGGAVRKPVTVKAPIGTAVGELLAAAGGPLPADYVVIDGGPMMGRFTTEDASVTKKTSGLLVFPREHPCVEKRTENPRLSTRHAAASCTVCEDCTKYCPRFLLGHRVTPHRAMRSQSWSVETPLEGYALSGAICCECGLCTLWSCPMNLRPREMMQSVKRAMGRERVANPFKGQAGPVHPAYRDRQIPVARLIKGLELEAWDVPAPLDERGLAPAAVRMPLSQHLGAPALPVVKKGDKVKRGDLIGEIPEKALGARLHASIDGEVVEVSDHIGIRRS